MWLLVPISLSLSPGLKCKKKSLKQEVVNLVILKINNRVPLSQRMNFKKSLSLKKHLNKPLKRWHKHHQMLNKPLKWWHKHHQMLNKPLKQRHKHHQIMLNKSLKQRHKHHQMLKKMSKSIMMFIIPTFAHTRCRTIMDPIYINMKLPNGWVLKRTIVRDGSNSRWSVWLFRERRVLKYSILDNITKL